jgi:hypothetical protein
MKGSFAKSSRAYTSGLLQPEDVPAVKKGTGSTAKDIMNT